MTQIDDLAKAAQAAKAAQDTVARLQSPSNVPRFQSSPEGVFWGRSLSNLPGNMRARGGGGDGLLFACDNPQAVADQLNAVMDAAVATHKATELAAAQAALATATNDLSTVVAAPETMTAIRAMASVKA